jgi:hypothetical protein
VHLLLRSLSRVGSRPVLQEVRDCRLKPSLTVRFVQGGKDRPKFRLQLSRYFRRAHTTGNAGSARTAPVLGISSRFQARGPSWIDGGPLALSEACSWVVQSRGAPSQDAFAGLRDPHQRAICHPLPITPYARRCVLWKEAPLFHIRVHQDRLVRWSWIPGASPAPFH